MTNRSRMIALTAVAAALFTAGCGSDDETAADSSSTAPESADSSMGSSAEETDAVKIVDFEFTPPEITVAAGTEVTFTNDDTSPHTATADDDSFDTGDLDQGASGEVTLDEPGTYAYFCNIHNYMTGSITVE